ncbi:MAG TPA: hypothetical protein PKA06_05500 [Gemmatales bacterium]|nr:hypothetical protein [Gemmatales bacterium]
MNEPEKQQQRIKEFLQLLPLTVELAGLPKSEPGKYYSAEQIETRVITLRNAYKVARQLITEIATQ